MASDSRTPQPPSVTRFRINALNDMDPDTQGNWVSYADYAKLEAEHVRIRALFAKLIDENEDDEDSFVRRRAT